LENRGAARASRAATAAAEDDLHPRRVVYFSSCVNRVFGPDDDPGPNTRPSVALTTTRAVIESLRAVRFEVIVPPDAESACCGMSFSSQAQPQAARIVAERTADLLFGASERGQLDVVTDASPCALTLQTQVATILGERGRAVRFFDFPTFWARVVLPNAKAPAKRLPSAVLHPTCSSIKAGSSEDFRAVAAFYCDDVTVPLTAACCGFAGDRGFFTPELTEAATRAEAEEVKTLDPSALHCSTCRTCEIGMTRATGRSYLSLAHLVHAAVVSSRALG
jgi:D-lactate dehydrogenase